MEKGFDSTLAALSTKVPDTTAILETRGNAIVAETVTSITGAQSRDSRNQVLRATIKSRQRNEKIVRQEILSEHSQLSAGAKPPTVDVVTTAGQHRSTV